jgi:hypothetical protein
MPQRVFVGFRNLKAKIMEGKRNMFNVQYLFQRQSSKKEANISDFYAIGTLLHFLDGSDIFHMANRGIKSINVCSTEWVKFEI